MFKYCIQFKFYFMWHIIVVGWMGMLQYGIRSLFFNNEPRWVLALDQVLRDLWSSLTYFGTSTACRRRSARKSRDHRILAPFWILFGIWDYVTSMGCQPMGLPMFRPIF
jgi:hypothetical protein